jgi:hypothetical protein
LGCGALLEVVETPGDEDGSFLIRITDRPSRGWFAELNGLPWSQSYRGSDVKLVILPEAIPKLIKIMQYLEKQSAT